MPTYSKSCSGRINIVGVIATELSGPVIYYETVWGAVWILGILEVVLDSVNIYQREIGGNVLISGNLSTGNTVQSVDVGGEVNITGVISGYSNEIGLEIEGTINIVGSLAACFQGIDNRCGNIQKIVRNFDPETGEFNMTFFYGKKTTNIFEKFMNAEIQRDTENMVDAMQHMYAYFNKQFQDSQAQIDKIKSNAELLIEQLSNQWVYKQIIATTSLNEPHGLFVNAPASPKLGDTYWCIDAGDAKYLKCKTNGSWTAIWEESP